LFQQVYPLPQRTHLYLQGGHAPFQGFHPGLQTLQSLFQALQPLLYGGQPSFHGTHPLARFVVVPGHLGNEGLYDLVDASLIISFSSFGSVIAAPLFRETS
jgi:hypothetical protein